MIQADYWERGRPARNRAARREVVEQDRTPDILMIARTWHGVTASAKADEYLTYLKETGVAEYERTEGNLGVYVLRRVEGDRAHFLLLTLWESEDAIKRFAGPNMQKAKYYSEDEEFLLELEPEVSHYEVLVSSAAR
jgi:heme-degrading monooxygenase HmoA